MNITPNSAGSGYSDIREGWGPEARAAAAAARKKGGKGIKARQEAARKAYRAAGGTATGSGRMKTPHPDKHMTLDKSERPIDYGHVHDLMQEKYGKGRGNKMYHDMINNPSSMQGLHFVVGSKIQKEKKHMKNVLGLPGHIDDHKYRDLHHKWVKGGAK